MMWMSPPGAAFGVAKGTPDDVKEVLYAAFEKAVNSEEFKELASQGQYSP